MPKYFLQKYLGKTGNLISLQSVTDADNLMIINESGLTLRLTCDQLRVMKRNTQGVRLINIKDTDSITKIENADRTEETDEESQVASEE